MPPVMTKRLGYGGSATVDGVQVLITGGGMEQSDTSSYLEMLDIDPTGTPTMASRSRVLHADGVSSFTGSLAFDVTKNALDKFTVSTLLARGYKFNIGITDGSDGTGTGWLMSNCYSTSLTLSGAAGGLITASISYMASDARTSAVVTNNYILDDYSSGAPTATDNQPMAYWWSGGVDVKDWTLTMNQAVSPVYGNQNTNLPKYLKVGLIDYQLDVVTYADVSPTLTDSIIIKSSTFTLWGVLSTKGYSFNGVTDLGTYSHSFATAAPITGGSGGGVLGIT